ncbi:hypothetical protein [Chryseolinea serpens]|nr:hypothetical protein [Chryseolinea serpens]
MPPNIVDAHDHHPSYVDVPIINVYHPGFLLVKNTNKGGGAAAD